ncbi:MAG: N-acetylmuramoyl-L-alanine amidase [Bacilli bacterium]|nr:N-acetylmuramoyl-L-alanine amidase [Bacilli bacterium]
MMKKTAFLCFFLFLIFLQSDISSGAKVPQIFLNGAKLNIEESPQIRKGNTFVPISLITGQLGGKVIRSDSLDKVTLEKAGSKIEFTMDEPDVYANGKKITLKIAPFIIHGVTMVPLRFIVEHFDLKVSWDPANHAINLQNVKQQQISIQLVGDSHPLYKIVIDPGHGGVDVGTVGIHGRFEKDFTLSMALKVKGLMDMEPAVKVYLTRTDDSFIPLDDRITMANQLSADLYLSIHANMDGNSNTKGTETFFNRKSSLFFAQIVQKHVQKATSFPDLHVDYENFRVIKNTVMPAALVEVGFLSNAAEEKELFMDHNQDKIAAAMVDGIKEYLGMK